VVERLYVSRLANLAVITGNPEGRILANESSGSKLLQDGEMNAAEAL
jgi:hypothetical protein